MSDNRILTIQDISCVGQCSLTVALPIISACGIECAVLPSAVLSTHTAGFTGFTCRDLTADIPAIADHWEREGIRFRAVYTGYLGSTEQIDMVADIFDRLCPDGVKIVDPAMADNGSLYPAFDKAYADAMGTLCRKADFILPNITEACFLTRLPYRTEYDGSYIRDLLAALHRLCPGTVVLTGVSYATGHTGVVVSTPERDDYYQHELLPNSCHGTGDIYASAFVGALMRGRTTFEAAKIAADYTVGCIRATAGDPNHWYGAKFEIALPQLIRALES